MEVDEQEIDENLYSRQLYVIDHASMKRVMGSNVLLLGLGGLGVEIAKNVILTGVKSLTLWDPQPASMLDLSSQFYLTEQDVQAGTGRAAASRSKLEELNPYVEVVHYDGKLTDEFLARFQVVVATDTPLEEQLRINSVCRSNGAKFISADVRGVFSSLFCDFGDEFVVVDKNGEALKSYMVSAITQENPGAVTLIEDVRCDLESGDYVTFKDVEGMTELNNCPPMKVNVKGPFALEIVDTTGFSTYRKGGAMQEVKMPVTMSFSSLERSIAEPEFFMTDFAKMDSPGHLHVGFMALQEFQKRNGRLPGSHNAEDASQLLALAKEFNAKQKTVEEIDEDLLTALSHTALAVVSPMASFLGGVVGQEVLKACTGKFTPIKQFMYFDAIEMLPEGDRDAAEFQPSNSRYDSQVVVFGKDVQQQVLDLNYFLVGSGAIGCELLKTWAAMGVGAGEKGLIHVTDMDTIEKSNLNRQFLFRPRDVSRLKSESAADAVKVMNPSMHIKPYSLRVGQETESIFNDAFYRSLSGVCNALDNVEARMYMDSQCINYRLSLLESGTLGTKGNTQVIVPDLTESYASSRDPPEKTIPMCTLHHFPNRIEHTIQWARDSFEGLFTGAAENVNAYLSQKSFLDTLAKQSLVARLEVVKTIYSCLVTDKPLTFEECIAWARQKFEDFFNNGIQQLLFNFPKDLITSSGAPFWSGPKKAPNPLQFDMENPDHLEFIVAAANLRAANYGLNGSRDLSLYRKVLPTIKVPDFTPSAKVAIPASDEEAEASKRKGGPPADVDQDELERLTKLLPDPDSLVGYRMEPAEFEKDVDENFHIDFITACSNLRAHNYAIAPADKHKTKGIAGKIIPAMVTTTAMVAGLVCIEMMKLVQKKKLEQYKNGFANLAIPFIAFSEPQQPETAEVRKGWKWSLWDRFDIKGPTTLQELLDYFQEKHQLEVTMASAGMTLIYAFFHKPSQTGPRLNVELMDLVEQITNKPCDRSASLQLTVCCSRVEDGEDVDVPWVNYHLV